MSAPLLNKLFGCTIDIINRLNIGLITIKIFITVNFLKIND